MLGTSVNRTLTPTSDPDHMSPLPLLPLQPSNQVRDKSGEERREIYDGPPCGPRLGDTG